MRIYPSVSRIVVAASLFLAVAIVAAHGQGAEACGVCHRDLHKEWLQSRHSLAWKSESFQAQLKAFGSPEFCGRCHAPLSVWRQVNLTPLENVPLGKSAAPDTKDFEEALEGNPVARSEALEDGVSCNSCHYVQVLWPGGQSEEVLGPYHSDASHTGKQSALFQSFALCGNCHGRDPEIYLPASGGGQGYHHLLSEAITFQAGDNDCGNCHMPPRQEVLVQLRVFKNLPERRVGEHTFAGKRYSMLEEALVFSVQEGSLAVTNRGVGHPLRISSDTRYKIRIEAGGKVQETVLTEAGSLRPGSTLKIPLEVEGPGLQLEFFRLDRDNFQEKLFSLQLE